MINEKFIDLIYLMCYGEFCCHLIQNIRLGISEILYMNIQK